MHVIVTSCKKKKKMAFKTSTHSTCGDLHNIYHDKNYLILQSVRVCIYTILCFTPENMIRKTTHNILMIWGNCEGHLYFYITSCNQNRIKLFDFSLRQEKQDWCFNLPRIAYQKCEVK